VLVSIPFDAAGTAGTDEGFARTGRMAAAFSDLADALLNRLEAE